ncbi:nucleotidyltransferase family protein [Bacteroides heparinolyticus]|uniref:nucleotidyltransferase family protein n=1 Tax=Prevotella heparinolytica TaxID=28113 RepID=UPI003C6C0BF0
MIEQQNKLLNKRIEQLFNILEKESFQCCLLKGQQGNASMYPNPLMRCFGGIDVWINTDEQPY